MKKTAICALVLSLIGNVVYAGTCEITTHREACPDQKDKAFAVYKTAKNPSGDPTVETKTADNADGCKNMVDIKSTKIARKRLLAKKVTTVKFDGTEVATFTDQSDCK